MLADLRHLARNLRRSPASAAAAILTLSLTLGAGAAILTVVDAVLLTPPPFADHRTLDEVFLPTVYLSALQAPSRSSIVVIRSARPDADAIAAVREEVARLDATLPVSRARSMQDVVAASRGMPERRVITATFMAFAVLALVLGAIGLFGVAAHDVSSRRTELALRIALGADPRRILGATLARGAVMVASGLAVGGGLSIWAARMLGSVGFATDRLDALSLAVPVVALLIAATAAILAAARRAAKTDPLATLRSD